MLRAERITALIAVALCAVDLILIAAKGQAVDWVGYGVMVLIGLGALALGLTYRRLGRSEEIALAAIAAALFILFTIFASIFNYLLLPVGALRLDLALIQLDASIGFSWAGFVAWAATMPGLGRALSYVYMSSLVQMTVLIIVLGFAGRREQLHQFLLTGVVGALLAITIWFAAPSMGPSVFEDISPELIEKLNLVVGPAYGAQLQSLALNGSSYISPMNVLGLIAFPSFHTVMACMAIWFTASLRPLFPVAMVLNVAMIPAILLHGGHHLVDIFGGIAVFVVALLIARMLATQPEKWAASPAQP